MDGSEKKMTFSTACKYLEIRFWRKILENEKLWEEGIMLAVFRNGETLRLLFEFFCRKTERAYQKLAEMIGTVPGCV